MTIDKDTVVLGVIEFNSIAVGFNSLDAMIKVAPIQIIDARTISLGKYIIVFSGDLASVEYSFLKGYETGKDYIVDSLTLPTVHPEVIEAIGKVKQTEEWGTIGILETLSVTSCIEAADIAAKESEIKIVEIRLADDIGEKSFLKMIGSLESVQASMDAGSKKVKSKNLLFAQTIIPQPQKEIKAFFMK